MKILPDESSESTQRYIIVTILCSRRSGIADATAEQRSISRPASSDLEKERAAGDARKGRENMEFKARWDKYAECYIIYCNGKEIGRAIDVEGIGEIIQYWQDTHK